jgi:glycosyltransferase involved in cell wall biosynthesis
MSDNVDPYAEDSSRALRDELVNAPTIGVAIPAYNAAKYLRRSLASVAAQQHLPTQIIVVDDGSTDLTHHIVEDFAAELTGQDREASPLTLAVDLSSKTPSNTIDIRCIRSPNAGAGAARNLAVANLRSEFIAFLDADDEWHPQWLARAAEQAMRTNDDLIFGTLINQVEPSLNSGEYRCPPHTDAPQTSCSVVQRSAFARFDRFADDSYSWVSWLAKARKQGLTEIRVQHDHKPVIAGTRWITGENITLRQDSKSQYLKIARELITNRRVASNQITQQNS